MYVDQTISEHRGRSDFLIYYLSSGPFTALFMYLFAHPSIHPSIHEWNKPFLIREWSFMIYLQRPTIVMWPYRTTVTMSSMWYHAQTRTVASTNRCRTIQTAETRSYARPAAIIGKFFRVSVDFMRRDERRSQSRFCTFPLISRCSDVTQGILSC